MKDVGDHPSSRVANAPHRLQRFHAALLETGVQSFIPDEKVARPHHDPRPAVSQVTGGEHHCGLFSQPAGDPLFEPGMELRRAVEHWRSGRTGPVSCQRLADRAKHVRVFAEPEIAVRGEVQHRPPLLRQRIDYRHFRAVVRNARSHPAVKVVSLFDAGIDASRENPGHQPKRNVFGKPPILVKTKPLLASNSKSWLIRSVVDISFVFCAIVHLTV